MKPFQMKPTLWTALVGGGLMLTGLNANASQAHCNAAATTISNIQGEQKHSPLRDKDVIVNAVVSAAMPKLGGYFLIEQTADWDNSDKTSEGIFVLDNQNKPNVGDVVAFKAKVSEFKGQTQLSQVSNFYICDSGAEVKYTTLSLPLTHRDQLENVEGMPVRFSQNLTISENYNLTRYGQLLLSKGRLFQPTNVELPGAAAQKVAADNQLNQITLDDGSSEKNPSLGFSVDHLYRVGNQVQDLKGVLYYSFGKFMVQPTEELQLVASNKRLAKPKIEHTGSVRVASFNVLNYFNGEGAEKKFPTKRGASSKEEFVRQNAKTVAAMHDIAADVFGLMELENDGYGKHSSIKELTDNLVKASGVNYAFIDPKMKRLGDDHIAVGMIYNADKVEPVGKTAILSEGPFGRKSRLPMAQSFKQKSNGEIFTLVVNHFKSKGGCPKDKTNPNANQKDGQGCWNPVRTESAKILAKWLESQPTGVKDSDVLIIGDLNAYAKEQPVTALEKAGYVNLLEKFQGKYAYSYVYRGLSGYLDHALSSASMTKQIVDTADWHINADELRATDYNLEFKTEKQKDDWYKADAFRSSDHDPVIVELELK